MTPAQIEQRVIHGVEQKLVNGNRRDPFTVSCFELLVG